MRMVDVFQRAAGDGRMVDVFWRRRASTGVLLLKKFSCLVRRATLPAFRTAMFAPRAEVIDQLPCSATTAVSRLWIASRIAATPVADGVGPRTTASVLLAPAHAEQAAAVMGGRLPPAM
jgi:hypothetical protein